MPPLDRQPDKPISQKPVSTPPTVKKVDTAPRLSSRTQPVERQEPPPSTTRQENQTAILPTTNATVKLTPAEATVSEPKVPQSPPRAKNHGDAANSLQPQKVPSSHNQITSNISQLNDVAANGPGNANKVLRNNGAKNNNGVGQDSAGAANHNHHPTNHNHMSNFHIGGNNHTTNHNSYRAPPAPRFLRENARNEPPPLSMSTDQQSRNLQRQQQQQQYSHQDDQQINKYRPVISRIFYRSDIKRIPGTKQGDYK